MISVNLDFFFQKIVTELLQSSMSSFKRNANRKS